MATLVPGINYGDGPYFPSPLDNLDSHIDSPINQDPLHTGSGSGSDFNFSSLPSSTGNITNNYYNVNSPYDDRYYKDKEADRAANLKAAEAEASAIRSSAYQNYLGILRQNASNEAINTANINFQKNENELARAREDNAVQRRVADLQKAGLSSTLSVGNPASAQAMTAPRAEMYYKNPYGPLYEAQVAIAEKKLQLMTQSSQVEYVNSLTRLNNIDAETRYQQNLANLDYSISKAKIEAVSKNISESTINNVIRQIDFSTLKTESEVRLLAEDIVEQQIKNDMLDYQNKMKAVTYWSDLINDSIRTFRGTTFQSNGGQLNFGF